MTQKIKFHWWLWLFMILIVISGAALYELSSSPHLVELQLKPKEETKINVISVLNQTLRASLLFKQPDIRRPELGKYTTLGDRKKSGILEFVEPGEAIKLLIRSNDKEMIYEALPAGNRGKVISRDLVPFIDDNNPNQFQWPPNKNLDHILTMGNNTIYVSVIETGKILTNEQVSLIIKPPVTFKMVFSGYGLIWFLRFWPIFVFLLIAYAGILLRHSSRNPLTI